MFSRVIISLFKKVILNFRQSAHPDHLNYSQDIKTARSSLQFKEKIEVMINFKSKPYVFTKTTHSNYSLAANLGIHFEQRK